eukprot:8544139-Pyramimonas_sp.AAC.1
MGEVRSDPIYRLRREHLEGFASTWAALGHSFQLLKVSALWKSKVQEFNRIPAKNIWCRVRGPVAATVAVLLDLGWVPLSPARWRDERG